MIAFKGERLNELSQFTHAMKRQCLAFSFLIQCVWLAQNWVKFATRSVKYIIIKSKLGSGSPSAKVGLA